MTGMPPPLTVRTNFTIGAQSISSQATATMHATCGKDWNMSRASSVLCAVRTLNFDVSSTSFRVESASPGSGSATISVGRRFTHLSQHVGCEAWQKSRNSRHQSLLRNSHSKSLAPVLMHRSSCSIMKKPLALRSCTATSAGHISLACYFRDGSWS
jgi:hypothetical protein